jgi:large subunit ribosomal protein L21
VYAIVRCGGRQEKATVDEVLTVDTLDGEAGSSVNLPALLVVDDGKVISDPAELSRYQVTAEILGTIAGPKINMIQFKNKTGYRRRLGHRQKYTQVKITSIGTGRKAPSSRKTSADTGESAAGQAAAEKAPASKAAAGRATAGKTTAGKTTAGKTTASRSTAAKATATKTPAAKTSAAKTPAAKTSAAKTSAAKSSAAGKTDAGEKTPAPRRTTATRKASADKPDSGKKD